MWAPFHKSSFYLKKGLRENSSKSASERRDLDNLFAELEDGEEPFYSDFFLPEPKTERLGYENTVFGDLEVGHSSIQGNT